jgi:nucleotide-binding universal stress UspA family protein
LDCAKSDLEAAGFTKLSEICVESDDVRDAVLAAVAKVHADAIVVGSRGFNMIKATFMGSLSSYLVSNSPVPVIVARNAQTNQRS